MLSVCTSGMELWSLCLRSFPVGPQRGEQAVLGIF
uniref:Uncharacterized protein n=1 Tax=Trichinella nativa TaxID=6335 RepID=A0A0V1KHF3_9BILA